MRPRRSSPDVPHSEQQEVVIQLADGMKPLLEMGLIAGQVP
jgi:hypothetical protein